MTKYAQLLVDFSVALFDFRNKFAVSFFCPRRVDKCQIIRGKFAADSQQFYFGFLLLRRD
jgi:hypothetical protein